MEMHFQYTTFSRNFSKAIGISHIMTGVCSLILPGNQFAIVTLDFLRFMSIVIHFDL